MYFSIQIFAQFDKSQYVNSPLLPWLLYLSFFCHVPLDPHSVEPKTTLVLLYVYTNNLYVYNNLSGLSECMLLTLLQAEPCLGEFHPYSFLPRIKPTFTLILHVYHTN